MTKCGDCGHKNRWHVEVPLEEWVCLCWCHEIKPQKEKKKLITGWPRK